MHGSLDKNLPPIAHEHSGEFRGDEAISIQFMSRDLFLRYWMRALRLGIAACAIVFIFHVYVGVRLPENSKRPSFA